MAFFHNPALIGASGQAGYQISRSLRFNSADSAYLNRTFGTPTNNIKWTWSGWVKRSAFGSYQNLFIGDDGSSNNFCYLRFSDVDKLECYQISGGSYNLRLETNGVFRDPSAWYHIVLIYDSANATSTDRVQVYVNSTRQTVSYVVGPFSQNTACQANVSSRAHAIGRLLYQNIHYFNGYLTEINFIDGQALTPSSFGETDTITGVWKPKKYTGTYSGNSFYLNFADNSGTTSTTLGKDSSGLGNNFTPNNFSVTAGAGNDSMIDTPTPYADGGNGRGNYCTWNPLAKTVTTGTWVNGNLEFTTAVGDGAHGYGTFAIPPSGKWYWEVVCSSGGNPMIGICQYSVSQTRAWQNTNSVFYYGSGQKYVDGTNGAYGSAYTTQTIGVAVDADAGTITFYRDNVSQGSITHAVVGLFPCVDDGASATSDTFVANFGQRSFSYTPPSGFLALNTQNLPDPTIKKPGTYMDVVTYTGNGGTQTLSSLNFSPDLVWIKSRSVGYDHQLTDSVRGTGKELQSDLTGAETSYGLVSALNSNGFTVFTNGTYLASNASGTTYVAWCWDESATPGFDIVTYTGNGASSQTLNHSLGVTPAMMITKQRSATGDWFVYHQNANASPQSGGLFLELTNAFTTNSGYWNNTAPTSTQFTVGTAGGLNASGVTAVAYLWSEVAGFSKFGSYTGNGSSDGPFLYCGFRPAFVIIKSSSSGYDWFMFDNKRDPENVVDLALFPNSSSAESGGSTYMFDFTSNGIKIRNSQLNLNGSGNTYIFCAWAENPFKYSLAR